jgi:hypothetical protein
VQIPEYFHTLLHSFTFVVLDGKGIEYEISCKIKHLFERSLGVCEFRLSPKCWDWISWDTMHAAHIVSEARGGPFTLSNLKASCAECISAGSTTEGNHAPPK